MKFQPYTLYHIYNQGNNRQPIFFKEDNYSFFIKKMEIHLSPLVDFMAYCLMPNHFHWLVYTKEDACQPSKAVKPRRREMEGEVEKIHPVLDYQQQLSQKIGILLSSYTRAINIQENRTGSLFRKETKSKNGIVDDVITVDGKHKDLFFKDQEDYSRICWHYIHQNPVKAGLVNKAEYWSFSSAKDFAGMRQNSLCNVELAREILKL